MCTGLESSAQNIHHKKNKKNKAKQSKRCANVQLTILLPVGRDLVDFHTMDGEEAWRRAASRPLLWSSIDLEIDMSKSRRS